MDPYKCRYTIFKETSQIFSQKLLALSYSCKWKTFQSRIHFISLFVQSLVRVLATKNHFNPRKHNFYLANATASMKCFKEVTMNVNEANGKVEGWAGMRRVLSIKDYFLAASEWTDTYLRMQLQLATLVQSRSK